MSPVAYVLVALAGFATAFHLVAAGCALWFRAHRDQAPPGGAWPQVACLKPLCGLDAGLAKNLESFAHQAYPDFEVVAGTAAAEDPAQTVAGSVCAASERCRRTHGELGEGTNRKIRNLRNVEAQLREETEVLVLTDSDVRVEEDFLRRSVAPLRDDPGVGLVTCLYRVASTPSVGALLEALSVEATFAPGVLVVNAFSSLRYAFGAAMVVRTVDLRRVGGLATLEDHLADDYRLGALVYQSGKRVVLSSSVVTLWPPPSDLRRAARHLLRWNRTIRACEPVGYFFSIVTCAGLWTLLATWALAPRPLAGVVLAAGFAARSLSAALVAAGLGSRPGIVRGLAAPLWDLCSAPLWALGLFGRKVRWREACYRIVNGDRLVEA